MNIEPRDDGKRPEPETIDESEVLLRREVVELLEHRIKQGSAEAEFYEDRVLNARSLAHPPVYYYRRDKHINATQHYAARKLYALWYIGALRHDIGSQQITEYVSKSPTDAKETMLDAWAAYRQAVDSIRDDDTRIVTLSVVCWEERAGAGKLGLLRKGLDDLVAHFQRMHELTCGKI